MGDVGAGDDQRFARLWHGHAARVVAYAARHVGSVDAQDVAAETFLVAWRRIDEVPEEPLGWLLGVARNVMRSRARSLRRRRRAEAELRDQVATAVASGPETETVDRAQLVAAFWRLSRTDREALLLVAWDGLAPEQGARVVGCSVPAFTMRVSRARARLRGAGETASDPPPGRRARPTGFTVATVEGSGRHG